VTELKVYTVYSGGTRVSRNIIKATLKGKVFIGLHVIRMRHPSDALSRYDNTGGLVWSGRFVGSFGAILVWSAKAYSHHHVTRKTQN